MSPHGRAKEAEHQARQSQAGFDLFTSLRVSASHSRAITYSLLLTNVQICGMVARVISNDPPAPLPPLHPYPRLLMLLRTLCRSQKSQLLWNQANPASFAKTPGVGYPFSATSVLRSQCPLCCAFSVRRSFTQSLVCEGPLRLHAVASHSQLSTVDCEPQFRPPPTPFRINTCKSVSKQTTLTPFRINTYEKHREGGGAQRPWRSPLQKAAATLRKTGWRDELAATKRRFDKERAGGPFGPPAPLLLRVRSGLFSGRRGCQPMRPLHVVRIALRHLP